MKNEQDDNLRPMTGFMVSGSIGLIILSIALLIWIGDETIPEQPVVVECKIVQPWSWINSGWKIMGPEDEPWLNELVKTNKAERKVLENHVSCTRYEDNKTPVTVKYDLVIWKVRA